jgi:hypothetical protein
MSFSRQNLIDELREKGIFPLHSKFQVDLKDLIITNLGYSIDELSQEQLAEVEEVAKQMNCKVRTRWNKCRRRYDLMIQKHSLYFNEIVYLSTFPATKRLVQSGTSCFQFDQIF